MYAQPQRRHPRAAPLQPAACISLDHGAVSGPREELNERFAGAIVGSQAGAVLGVGADAGGEATVRWNSAGRARTRRRARSGSRAPLARRDRLRPWTMRSAWYRHPGAAPAGFHLLGDASRSRHAHEMNAADAPVADRDSGWIWRPAASAERPRRADVRALRSPAATAIRSWWRRPGPWCRQRSCRLGELLRRSGGRMITS